MNPVDYLIHSIICRCLLRNHSDKAIQVYLHSNSHQLIQRSKPIGKKSSSYVCETSGEVSVDLLLMRSFCSCCCRPCYNSTSLTIFYFRFFCFSCLCFSYYHNGFFITSLCFLPSFILRFRQNFFFFLKTLGNII